MPSSLSDHSSTLPKTTSTATKWITLAVASGTFAALNGLFAKLTTTEVTGSAAKTIAQALNLPEGIIEAIVRAICFGLNLLSNFIMWAFFTRSLTAAPSTTKVSITNTSSNFLVTAILGMIVFGERVGGLWWLGAGMMGAGCILVGMRDEKEKETPVNRSGEQDGEEETITLDGEEVLHGNNVDASGADDEVGSYHDEDEGEALDSVTASNELR